MSRKEMKKKAKHVLKKHYGFLLIVCLIATFLGCEFSAFISPSISGSSSGGVVSMHGGGTPSVLSHVYADLSAGDLTGGKALAESALDTQQHQNKFPVLGGSRGVLSYIITSITSASLLVKGYMAVNNMIHSEKWTSIILIGLSLFFSLLISIFIQSVYVVISRRIFLEARTYEKISASKFLFLLRTKRWVHTGLNMLVVSIYRTLWSLTIVGGVIKYYSYFLVPYILAENPDLTANEAVTLSRKLMYGHKWECFVLQISFILWGFLGAVTFGIATALFVNPYRLSVYSEYYAALRQAAIDRNLEGTEKLNDIYLYKKPEPELAEQSYSNMISIMNEPVEAPKLSGLQGFLSRWCGLILYNSDKVDKYEQLLARQEKAKIVRDIIDGRIYPDRLFPLQPEKKREHLESVRYARNYSLTSIILLFFAFSMIGWLWEVSLHLITDGVFVNRGVMHGPWLPIYGSGGVLILLILKRFRTKPALEFFSIVLLCGCVEYFSSWYLEISHNGVRWWDYTGYFLNLNGRICAEGLLVFGLGGMLIVYFAAPLFDNLFRKVRMRVLYPVCLILLVIFVADQVYSHKKPNTGTGITDYDHVAEAPSAYDAHLC